MDGFYKFGIVGDVHAEDSLLEMALLTLKEHNVQKVLCPGDIVDGPGDVNRCCQLLLEHEVVTVRGNHERWFFGNTMRDLPFTTEPHQVSSSSQAYLQQLPQTMILKTNVGDLMLCHGLGSNDMGRLSPDDQGYSLEENTDLQHLLQASNLAIVVAGHTHRRMVYRIGHVTFLNAGTLFHRHTPGFCMVDLQMGIVQFFDFVSGKVEQGSVFSLPGTF